MYFHYTKYLQAIIDTGVIKTEDITTPATNTAVVKPGVWLTTRETFEPRCLPAITFGPSKRLATFEEVVAEMDVGRLVIPDDYPGLLTWGQWRALHLRNKTHLEGIAQMARYAAQVGSVTQQYRWCGRAIPVTACTRIER